MAEMLFDQAGKRYWHTGVSAVALFVIADTAHPAPTKTDDMGATSLYQKGVPWDGVTSASDSPEGGDETELWADNIKYGSMRAAEKSNGSIECYQFPMEFWPCNGAAIKNGAVIRNQSRKKFAYAYKTRIGNDQSDDAGEILHLVWNSSTSPSEHTSETMNDSPDAGTFSFDYASDTVAYTMPKYANDPDLKPCSTMEIPTTNFENGKNDVNYQKLLGIIYGTATTEPQMPSPDDVLEILGG